jgi:hypothetical protein
MKYGHLILIGLFAIALVAGCTSIPASPSANQSANQSNGTAQAPSQSEILVSAEQQVDAEIIPSNSTGVVIGEMI